MAHSTLRTRVAWLSEFDRGDGVQISHGSIICGAHLRGWRCVVWKCLRRWGVGVGGRGTSGGGGGGGGGGVGGGGGD
ncbi:unnamed protein product [Taenia asiatica]|uniref:Uncharacterized protein n=1 Tax=Taenia asiatica TaxID=60517 RepID=A0A0R3VVG6_TAEAS|nr:unnamed protein product [Taenia asiatica]